MKMQDDFFKMPGGGTAITDGKSRDSGDSGGTGSGSARASSSATSGGVPVTQTYIPSVTGCEILDISNTKNLYHVKPDGSRVYRVGTTRG